MASFAKNLSRALLPLSLALPCVACVAGPAEDPPLGVAQQAVPGVDIPPCPDGGTLVQLPSQYGDAYAEPGYGYGYGSGWGRGYGYSSPAYGYEGAGYGYGGLGYGYGGYGYGSPGYGYDEPAYGGWGAGYPGSAWGYGGQDGVPAGYAVMVVGDGGLGLCQQ